MTISLYIYSGGAMHLNNYNYHLTIQSTVFDSNSATRVSGGAIYMYLSNSFIDISECNFRNNTAWNRDTGSIIS